MRDFDNEKNYDDYEYGDYMCDGDCESCDCAYECENSTVLDEF